MKIGLIAGSGDLPHVIIAAVQASGHDICLVSLVGEVTSFSVKTHHAGLAEFGKVTKIFHQAGCTHVCFAGYVSRPDFKNLKPDFKTLQHIPKAIKAAQKGDGALLEYVLKIFEQDGFEILSAQDIAKGLLMPVGYLGTHRMRKSHRMDCEKACEIVQSMGKLDIGQAIVVCRGLVLAVEAQEGTSNMLKRVMDLPPALLGHAQCREGVLIKWAKPHQDRRIDLPTIGVQTVEWAAQAGLAGIVLEAGGALILERKALIACADALGLFIVGIEASGA